MKSDIKVRIEQLSFQSCGTYMDVQVHDGYVDITIGGVENEKFSVELEDWKIISKRIFDLIQQEKNLEKNEESTTINR